MAPRGMGCMSLGMGEGDLEEAAKRMREAVRDLVEVEKGMKEGKALL